MTTGPLNVVIQNLRAELGPEGDGVTDGELVARFVRSRDEIALAVLMQRHASMVWGVCRRLLSHHDAEDAFQATFLVLVRKAPSVPEQAVANWLYGVARQTAIRLRSLVAKQGRREAQVMHTPEPTVPEVPDADLPTTVDAELSHLPGHYRGVLVLCDLEGLTRKEAAQQLGIPEGSVASRLARARALLAKRLTQRGVVFSGSVAVLSLSAPAALVATTVKVANLNVPGLIANNVIALAEGVSKAMFLTKLKSLLAVVLVVVLVLGGIGLGVSLATKSVAAQTETPKETPAKKEAPAPPAVTKEAEKPLHFVEKTDMKPQFPWLPLKIEGEVTEEQIYVSSKGFISDICLPGKIRLRDFIDPRYLKKHGLTDRDLAYEILDHQGLKNYQVADDTRTILFQVEAKGGGKEMIAVRWTVYEGRLYIAPEKAPDPKTGIFKPWILRTKVY